MNVLHGGYEELCHVVWVHKHFVFDSYGFNLYGGVVAGDVGLVPRVVLSVILDGMVRQIVTRKATGVILQMIKDDKIVDLIVLLAGPILSHQEIQASAINSISCIILRNFYELNINYLNNIRNFATTS